MARKSTLNKIEQLKNQRATLAEQYAKAEQDLASINNKIATYNSEIENYKTVRRKDISKYDTYTQKINSLKSERNPYGEQQQSANKSVKDIQKQLDQIDADITVLTERSIEETKQEQLDGIREMVDVKTIHPATKKNILGLAENYDPVTVVSADGGLGSYGSSGGTVNPGVNGMADIDGFAAVPLTAAKLDFNEGNLAKSIYHSVNLFKENELDLIHKRYRYGILNAYAGLNTTREFLFFTKPDLNIILPPGTKGDPPSNIVSLDLSGKSGIPSKYLNGVLSNYPYWNELIARYPGVIEALQSSFHVNGISDPFNHLLENMVQSTIDVPGLSAELQETPSNMYGVNYTYRGSSEASDDGFDFSLEFKDTKYLHVYNFFKAYEEYETLKHHGVIGPWKNYIINKVLHDQYSIYKFVVGEDGETIVYYAKYFGVKSKSLPRDVFNSNNFDNGLSYSIDFNAAFVEDMNPLILTDFNALSYAYWNSLPYNVDVYDFRYDQVDNRPTKAAIIVKEEDGGNGYKVVGGGKINDSVAESKKASKHPGGYCYKIKWRGGDAV